jgi:cytoskeletal protein CcmA (bactofilin family)
MDVVTRAAHADRKKDSRMWNRETPVAPDHPRPMVPVPPISPALPVEERRTTAWVGQSVVFKGTLISSEDMTIDGNVEGTIEIPDHGLTIGPDANIRAEIIAATITIHGSVTGNIRASARADIRATGRIEGDVMAPRIAMADGAIVDGQVVTSGEKPDARLRPELAIV